MNIKPLVTAVRLGLAKMLGFPMCFYIVVKNSKGGLTRIDYPIYEQRK